MYEVLFFLCVLENLCEKRADTCGLLPLCRRRGHLLSAGLSGLGTCRPHQPRVPLASALRGMQRSTLAAERASPQSGKGASHHAVGPLLSRSAASGWDGGPCRPVAATLAPYLWGENSAKPYIRGINLLHSFLVEICIRLLNCTDWSSQKAIPQFDFKAPCSLLYQV